MADHDYKHGGWKNKYLIRKLCGDCKGSGEERGFMVWQCDTCGGVGSLPCDENAVYFVLRLDEDPHARKAALSYAESVEAENPQFAADIRELVNKYQQSGEAGEGG